METLIAKENFALAYPLKRSTSSTCSGPFCLLREMACVAKECIPFFKEMKISKYWKPNNKYFWRALFVSGGTNNPQFICTMVQIN